MALNVQKEGFNNYPGWIFSYCTIIYAKKPTVHTTPSPSLVQMGRKIKEVFGHFINVFDINFKTDLFFLNEELYHTTPQLFFFTWLGISQHSLAWHCTRKLTVNYRERNQHIREHWTIAIRQNKRWLFHWLSLPALTTCIAGKKLTWLRTFPFLTMISQGMC